MAYELKKNATMNVKGVDYRYVLWSMTKNGAINKLNNSKFDGKGTLSIWVLVQIKQALN